MAKIKLLFIFLQRNNGLTRQNLIHKNTPKCCFENFPSLKSSKTRVIILNISFKIQLYRPNKHSYDTLVTTSSLQCKNILKNSVVNEKTAKIQQQEKSRSLSTFAEKHARASPFPHHTSISATSARFTAHNRPLYKRPANNSELNLVHWLITL